MIFSLNCFVEKNQKFVENENLERKTIKTIWIIYRKSYQGKKAAEDADPMKDSRPK